MINIPVKSCSIYLNRECPRNCSYCEISKERKAVLTVEGWKIAFDNLRRQLGIEFFLILGNEPLLLGEDLVKLVNFWKEENYYYALYSTSPPVLFNEYKDKLINAGLNNWSSGIDFIPEVYEEMFYHGAEFSESTVKLVEGENESLIKKASESLDGLKYMSEHGIQSHALITLSKMNYEFFPEMMAWFKRNLPDVHVGFSAVEFKTWERMDFACEKEDYPEYYFTEDDIPKLNQMINRFLKMRADEVFYTQIPNNYLINMVKYGIKLNFFCYGHHIPSVDCDGTFRTCGYCYGVESAKHDVLMFNEEEFKKDWEKDVMQCPGCYWAFPVIAKTAHNTNELFKIENLKGRIIE